MTIESETTLLCNDLALGMLNLILRAKVRLLTTNRELKFQNRTVYLLTFSESRACNFYHDFCKQSDHTRSYPKISENISKISEHAQSICGYRFQFKMCFAKNIISIFNPPSKIEEFTIASSLHVSVTAINS